MGLWVLHVVQCSIGRPGLSTDSELQPVDLPMAKEYQIYMIALYPAPLSSYNSRMSQYIDSDLPLVELHRHLDGSVRLETILEFGLAHNLPLPARELETLRPFVQVTEPVTDILSFFEKFEWQRGILVDYLAAHNIGIESNLTSNMQTSTVPSYETHPLKEMLRH